MRQQWTVTMANAPTSIRDAIAELRALAQHLPRPGCDWESRPEFRAPPSPEEHEGVLRSIGWPLPDDLLAFLSLSGGISGMSVRNGYHLCGVTELVGFAPCLSGRWLVELSAEHGAEPVVAVALDGGGNVFLASRSGAVWRWDHETGKPTRVAGTFTEFLNRIVADWRAYVEDRQGWTYLV